MAFGLSAGAVSLIGAGVGAAGSYLSSKNAAKAGQAGQNQSGTQNGTQTGSQTSSTTQGLNPAISQLLGLNGGGVLGGVTGSLGQQNLLSNVGTDFINQHAAGALNNGYAATDSLIKEPYQFPTMGAAQIAAPGQNGINLSPTFNSLLSGGNNSALRDSLQYGTSLTGAQFQKNQTDLTNNLQRNILPGIGSNAVLAGQYGGSRQGVAEGNAISDFTNQLNNSNTQMGLANSANTSGQLANSYEQGQNRALSAAQGLSGQQYSTAAADAAARQAADNTNVSSLLNTNALNSSNKIAGIGLQQGLVNSAGNYANSDLSRLGMTAGILAPFTNAGATVNNTSNNTSNTSNQTTGNVTQPLYQNTAGNVLGGGLLGGQIGSQLSGMFGGGTPSTLSGMQGSTYSPLSSYTPSSGGSTDWNAIRNLYS